MRALNALVMKMFPGVALNMDDTMPPVPPSKSVAVYTDEYGDLFTRLPNGTIKKFAAAGSSVPVGALFEFGGDTAPTGYLLCNGAAVSRTTYADLYAVYGTKYGAGDGSTTFNLPNIQDRVPVGASATKALGSTGGQDSVTLTTSNLPAHAHSINSHGHSQANHTHSLVHTHGMTHDHPDVSGGTHNHTKTWRENAASFGPQDNVAAAGGTGGSVVTKNISLLDQGGHSHTISNSAKTSTDGPSTSITDDNGAAIGGSGTLTSNNTGGGTSFSVQNSYVALNYIVKF